MPECHSTNDIASEYARNENIREGTVVYTDHQTSGRGQRGNLWLSEANQNLTFSIILRPRFLTISENYYLNIFVSLAIHDTLTRILSYDVKIKWPNDIYYQNHKICGILIENFIKGPHIYATVAGIGLNVNQEKIEAANATSLYQITGQRFNIRNILTILLENLENRYLQVQSGAFEKLIKDYYCHLYWLEETHIFADRDGEFEGKITGINGHGKLQIKSDRGLQTFDIKEVDYII